MKSKDTKKVRSFTTETPKKLDKNLFTLSPAILPDDQLIIKNYWGKKVTNPNPIITFKGITVLRAGAKLIIKAEPKAGKTSLVEAIVASYLNPAAPSMGFQAKLYGRTKILFIDTEQSEFESQRSYERIMTRCDFDLSLPEPPEEDKQLIHINFKRLHPEQMVEQITTILNKNPELGLIIIDVITDLSTDSVMEMKEAMKILSLLNSISEEIGIVCCIHVNAGDGLKKPSRGHLGRELERKCSALVYLSKEDHNTIKIELETNRTGSNVDPVYCKWNDDLEIFVEADYDKPDIRINEKQSKRDIANRSLLHSIFNFAKVPELSHTYISEQLVNMGTSPNMNSARQYVTRNFKPILDQSGTGYKLPDSGLIISLEARTK